MTGRSAPRGLVELYRQSLKPADSLFNTYIARVLAAPFVWLFARTPITPNQVTFLSTLVMALGMGALASVSGPWGLYLGLIGLELSYVFDCVDGQLARVTGRTSEVGASLDFMMDELKAYLLIAAIAARLFFFGPPLTGGDLIASNLGLDAPLPAASALLLGLVTLVVFASAISLTRFTRSAEYAKATGVEQVKHGQAAGEGRSGGPLWPVKATIRLISQYPTTFPIFIFFDALDLFLYAYGAVHVLYVAQAGLGVLLKLARPTPSSATPTPQTENTALDPEGRAEESL